jgi:uncharacterized protein (TIGR03084 family)
LIVSGRDALFETTATSFEWEDLQVVRGLIPGKSDDRTALCQQQCLLRLRGGGKDRTDAFVLHSVNNDVYACLISEYDPEMIDRLEVLRLDLASESEELFSVLERLDHTAWTTPTKCTPWTIKDQVSHLAWNDEATVFALTRPEEFLGAKPSTMDGIQRMVDQVIVDHHDRSGGELLVWFRAARSDLLGAFAGRDPRARMPWYGPDMSLVSKLTARFMETWAHGYDILDALGIEAQPTDRARHVVFLGLQALPNTFTTRGLPVPTAPIRIEARTPGGELLHFGPSYAVNTVRGALQELALLVTQRLHVDDSAIVADGAVAVQWLSIAQAFAGPPGPGRNPTR